MGEIGAFLLGFLVVFIVGLWIMYGEDIFKL
jgi:hypothetical protein